MTPEMLARLHAAAGADRPWSAAEFAALLTHPCTIVTGGDHAFALGRVVLDEAEVLMIATDPNHRRRGFGRSALHALHMTAAARGAHNVFLEVDAENTPARCLYDASGYVETGRRRGYYVHAGRAASDAITMACALVTADKAPATT